MPMPESEIRPDQKPGDSLAGAMVKFLLIPVILGGACLAIPYNVALRWTRKLRERGFRRLMRSKQNRFMTQQDFFRAMRERGGTCIEERFSPKGPVRFWWTPENLYRESPYEIIDWFTMRKGRQYEPFVHWCRQRYTSAEEGSAVLADIRLAAKNEIYALWSECRSETAKARWVEVAPPEILPPRPGQ